MREINWTVSGDDAEEGISSEFVGISCDEEGNIAVRFPLGFRISDSSDAEGRRKDAWLLMMSLFRNPKWRDSELRGDASDFSDENSFPMQAYIFLIRDFLSHGYYAETEMREAKSGEGKINWHRTIKKQKGYIQDEGVYYLNFITKKKQCNENELISLIHECCVYEAFDKMGWLFGFDGFPRKPRIDFQENMHIFRPVLTDKINSTFNDRNRALFQNMLAMVSYLADSKSPARFYYGTRDFEYVWESMVDRVYGIKDKEEYLPRTEWHVGDETYNKKPLRPDTIIEFEGNIYILDSKYYRYGITGCQKHLPDSASISKQITYGEHVSRVVDARSKGGKARVYNAFILPYNAQKNACGASGSHLCYAGYATADWKAGASEYEAVLAILLDTKHLMECDSEADEAEIGLMTALIESVNLGKTEAQSECAYSEKPENAMPDGR